MRARSTPRYAAVRHGLVAAQMRLTEHPLACHGKEGGRGRLLPGANSAQARPGHTRVLTAWLYGPG